MVFVLAHVGHVVGLLSHELEVEEVGWFESSIDVVVVPVGRSGVNVKTERISVAHGVDPLLSDVLSHVWVALLAEGDLDDLRSQGRKLGLVLHEGADATLLVPDEEVLAGLLGAVDGLLEPLESESWPGFDRLVSFDHFRTE